MKLHAIKNIALTMFHVFCTLGRAMFSSRYFLIRAKRGASLSVASTSAAVPGANCDIAWSSSRMDSVRR